MDRTTTQQTPADPFDHPLYRIAHLHGTEWVTLKPAAQHSRRVDATGEWEGANIYVCPTCEETVAIQPN
jgi:hypothetical protein